MILLFYDLIYTLPVCMAVLILGHSFLGIPEVTALQVLYALSCGILCVVFSHCKARGRIVLCGIIGTACACMLFILKLQWIRGNLWIIWVFLLSVCSLILVKGINRIMPLKAATGILALAVLIVLMVCGHETNKAVFCLLLFVLLAVIIELIQAYWIKEGNNNSRYLVLILPFLVPIFLIIAFAKIPSKPYDWKFFREILQDVRTGYEVMLQSVLPGESWDGDDNMGFSDRGVINGRLQNNPYRAFTVSSDSENDYRVYLGGKTFDTFDGRKWKKTDQSAEDYSGLDRMETIAAIEKADPEHFNDYIHNVRIRISYDGIRTKYLFMPPKSLLTASDVQTRRIGGDLLQKSSKKAEYTLSTCRINRDLPRFRNLLLNEQALSDKEWIDAASAHKGMQQDMLTPGQYRSYREEIYRTYAKPVQLSQKAQDYLDTKLEGANTKFEKLERIEQMLSGFTYTRTPGDLPDSIHSEADFVDHLLFEQPEGFCTHFATAFVILSRSQGIPARYVQGYSVISKSRNFEVLSDRAHAWPEAYFDGIGWIVFEPTPGFKQVSGWVVNDGGIASSSHELYLENTEEENAQNAKEELPGIRIHWKEAIKPLLFGVLFVILFLAADTIIRRIRYKRMNDREKILSLGKKYMRLLRRTGARREEWETLSEYRSRNTQIPDTVLSFIDYYEQALYSNKNIFTQEVSHMESLHASCRKYIFTWIRSLFRKNKRNAHNP